METRWCIWQLCPLADHLGFASSCHRISLDDSTTPGHQEPNCDSKIGLAPSLCSADVFAKRNFKGPCAFSVCDKRWHLWFVISWRAHQDPLAPEPLSKSVLIDFILGVVVCGISCSQVAITHQSKGQDQSTQEVCHPLVDLGWNE